MAFSSIFEYQCFLPTQGALRDPRYFSWTSNLRLVKRNLSSSKLTALVRNTKIRKSHNYVQIHSLCLILVVLYTFFEYQCFLPTQGALRDPRYFSWTNNLRLVKRNLSSSKLTALVRNTKIQKSHNYVQKSFIMSHISGIIHVFRVSVFFTHTRCSAGARIFFLDKQSETCQKSLEPQQTQSS